MATSKNVVIVGGGIIGLSTAFYATQKGHKVTLLERGPATHDGCSQGNAGMIVPSHFIPLAAPGMVQMGLKMMMNPESPFYIRPRMDWGLLDWSLKFMRSCTKDHVDRSAPILRDLSLASKARFAELASSPDFDFGLTKLGLLMLCKEESTLNAERHVAELAHKQGLGAEVLSPGETAKLDPNVRMDVAGSVYFPDDCHLTPGKLLGGLTNALKASDARFLWDTEALGWHRVGDRIVGVQTNQSVIEADEFVIAGGSWSPSISTELQVNLPMQAGKGYSLTLPAPPHLPRLCSILTEARVAVTPMGQSLRVAGTMEVCGLDESVNPVRVRGIVKSIPRYFPAFSEGDFAGIEPWAGLRPCSPDGLPYIGRTKRYRNLTIATGHSMLGLSLGPITGTLVSEILSGEATSLDIALLSPDRYA